jgi:uncharacterized membrane protein YhaH (DUF805 family)
MSNYFRDLWRWNDRVTGRTYFFVGVVALALKQVIDNGIAYLFYGRVPTVFPYWPYWAPFGPAVRITDLSGSQARFVAAMLFVAAPFLWLGLSLTVRRLRDIGQPVWLVVLFFVPFVNLIFFAALCLLPSRQHQPAGEAAPWPAVRPFDSLIPRSKLGSALLSILVSGGLGLGLSVIGTTILASYGWGLFVALPFCLGLFSVLVHSYHQEREFGTCVGVAMLPVVLVGMSLLGFGKEGMLCMLMAAPLALGLAFLGGWLGYVIQMTYWMRASPAMLSIVLLLTPSVLGIERLVKLKPPTFEVGSEILINAPPEIVWQKVVSFAEIPPPREAIFRAGIAYPIRADISGEGPGAVRRCEFSTGAFVEPIEVWNEPYLLKFSGLENPPPLTELSPYAHVKPPHLEKYFVSHAGQFLLTALPGGKTRLQGTTWYSDAMWPQAYWQLWSDYIVHRIHMRVLNHIRAEVEQTTR